MRRPAMILSTLALLTLASATYPGEEPADTVDLNYPAGLEFVCATTETTVYKAILVAGDKQFPATSTPSKRVLEMAVTVKDAEAKKCPQKIRLLYKKDSRVENDESGGEEEFEEASSLQSRTIEIEKDKDVCAFIDGKADEKRTWKGVTRRYHRIFGWTEIITGGQSLETDKKWDLTAAQCLALCDATAPSNSVLDEPAKAEFKAFAKTSPLKDGKLSLEAQFTGSAKTASIANAPVTEWTLQLDLTVELDGKSGRVLSVLSKAVARWEPVVNGAARRKIIEDSETVSSALSYK